MMKSFRNDFPEEQQNCFPVIAPGNQKYIKLYSGENFSMIQKF